MQRNIRGLVAIAVVAVVAVVAVLLVTDVFGDDDDSAADAPPVDDRLGRDGGLGIAVRGAALVPDDDDTHLLASVLDDDGSHLYYLDLDSDEPIRWRGEFDPLPPLFGPHVATPGTVFTVATDRLVAWDRENGDELFSIDLSGGVHPNPDACHRCVGIFDDTLLVLTDDGNLSGYDPGNGDELWSVDFEGPGTPPNQVVDFDGQPAVPHVDDDGVPRLDVIDPTSGDLAASVALDCGDDGDGTAARSVGHLAALPDGGFFWQGTDDLGTCAQRFEPGSSTPTWSTPTSRVAAAVPVTHSNVEVVDGSVAVADQDALVRFDIETGERSETSLQGRDPAILGSDDGVVYVGVEHREDRGTWTIMAIDSASGEVVWEHDPGTDRHVHLPGLPSAISGWAAEVVSGGLVVITPGSDDDILEVRVVTADDGATGDAIGLDLRDYATNAVPAIVGADDDRLVVAVEASILLVDLTSGEIVNVTR